jgi:hypothetical protein
VLQGSSPLGAWASENPEVALGRAGQVMVNLTNSSVLWLHDGLAQHPAGSHFWHRYPGQPLLGGPSRIYLIISGWAGILCVHRSSQLPSLTCSQRLAGKGPCGHSPTLTYPPHSGSLSFSSFVPGQAETLQPQGPAEDTIH